MNARTLLLIIIALVAAGLILGFTQQAGKFTQQAGKSEVVLVGSGATFPQPQVERWIDTYMSLHKNVKIEYTGKGSGGGQNDFKEGLVDFACSDPPIKESLWKELEKRGQPLQFPMIIGAVVVVHSIPKVGELKLDGKTVADIFMGKIEYWDNERIKGLNPGVNLPHEKIIVIHRSDSSGTTDIFTNYLSIVSPEWASKVGAGKLVNWPVDEMGRGVGGYGNQGVVAALKKTPYAIAYTELSYAIKENLKVVAIKNKLGKFLTPNPETIRAAIAATAYNVPKPTEGYKEDIRSFLNANAENAYPIVAFSHMLIWQKYSDNGKDRAIKDFVRWILTEGQKESNIVEGYVGLPKGLAEKIVKEIGL